MQHKPPYYAVIFTSVRTQVDEGYADMADAMMDLAARQPGFLGVEHARETVGITISYWSSLGAIADWKAQADHQLAQKLGKEKWYAQYTIRVCRVERAYDFDAGPS